MDWASTIIGTSYLIAPIFAWLWQFAKLPKVKWEPIAAGAMFAFAGAMLNALAEAFKPYVTTQIGSSLMAFFSFFGTISNMIGLAVIGFYAFFVALKLCKF